MHRSLVVGALALGGFTLGTTEFATMGVLPAFARGLGIGAPEASRAVSAYALGVVIGAPVIAVAGARMPRRALLTGMMVFYAATNALSALAPGFGLFVASRFLNGLPHGAYLGVAALVAASLGEAGERARLVARMLLGLTIATIVGVPLATALGQAFGWRSAFGVMAALALVTAAIVGAVTPRDAHAAGRSPLAELGALRRPQIWLTLGTAAIGFGGMFSIYTYLGPTLAAVTGAPPRVLPVALACFGVGFTVGLLVAARLADRAPMPTIAILLVWSAVTEGFYAAAAGSLPLVLLAVACVGAGGGLGAPIQIRLMNVAGDAQTLAAALMHSAFNTANALGPAIGAIVLAHGFGWRATGTIGIALSGAGLLVWAISLALERRRVPAVG